MSLILESYAEQVEVWPRSGRHILAQFDDESIVVYQAYCRAIAEFALRHGTFGDGFGYSRMSWIKPNFLWMMYRSGWGTGTNQEVTLALRIRRAFFDRLLAEAVPSSWDHALHATKEEWMRAAASSSVRVQWDPDHDPSGAREARRALQLGLRGPVLGDFGRRELMEIIDLSGFVAEQRLVLQSRGRAAILIPRERVYRPADPAVAARLGLAE